MMTATQSGCHVCGSVMDDEDLHRRWHGLEAAEWKQQKKAAEPEVKAKETTAKPDKTDPPAAAAAASKSDGAV